MLILIKFYINEDLNIDAKALRANLKLISSSAKVLGYDAKVSGNNVVIEKESYAADELKVISPTILKECKHEKLLPDGIAYKGEKSIFSNFFPAPFTIDEIEFSNVEQYFQYSKAITCIAGYIARKIMLRNDAWRAKAMGRRVEANAKWNHAKMKVLYDAVYAQFDQSSKQALKQDLLNTEGLQLYEATADLYYGVCLDISSANWVQVKEYKGENVAGKIVMKVREEFLCEEMLGQTHNDTINNLESDDLNLSQAQPMEGIQSTNPKDVSTTSDKPVASKKTPNRRVPRHKSQELDEPDWPELPATNKSGYRYKDVVKSPPQTSPVDQYSSTRGRGGGWAQRGRGQRRGQHRKSDNHSRQFSQKTNRLSDATETS